MPEIFAENILHDTYLLKEPGILKAPDQPQQASLAMPQVQRVMTIADEERSNPLRELVSWRALSRPYHKKDRSFYTTIAILLALFSPVALFLGGTSLFLALLALGFAVYVFNLVPPEEVGYKLTSQGVTIGDHFYHWQELDSFWLSQKDRHSILNILTRYRFPNLLMLVLDGEKIDDIKTICARYLPFHEIMQKTLIEKWSDALQKYFPLENSQK